MIDPAEKLAISNSAEPAEGTSRLTLDQLVKSASERSAAGGPGTMRFVFKDNDGDTVVFYISSEDGRDLEHNEIRLFIEKTQNGDRYYMDSVDGEFYYAIGSETEPAYRFIKKGGEILTEVWAVDGIAHRDSDKGPAVRRGNTLHFVEHGSYVEQLVDGPYNLFKYGVKNKEGIPLLALKQSMRGVFGPMSGKAVQISSGGQPSEVQYNLNGDEKKKVWTNEKGQIHRDPAVGPASIDYYAPGEAEKPGTPSIELFMVNGAYWRGAMPGSSIKKTYHPSGLVHEHAYWNDQGDLELAVMLNQMDPVTGEQVMFGKPSSVGSVDDVDARFSD